MADDFLGDENGATGRNSATQVQDFMSSDDVTAEGVEYMRQLASGKMEGKTWKRIDGFGIGPGLRPE